MQLTRLTVAKGSGGQWYMSIRYTLSPDEKKKAKETRITRRLLPSHVGDALNQGIADSYGIDHDDDGTGTISIVTPRLATMSDSARKALATKVFDKAKSNLKNFLK